MAVTTFSLVQGGGPLQINDATAGPQSRPTIVGGTFGPVAFYFDGGVAGGRILGRPVGSGGPTGAEFVVGDGAADNFVEAAVLLDGNIVVCWQDSSAVSNILYRVYSPTLEPLTDALLAESSALPTGDPDVSAMQDGGFVIAWGELKSATDSDVSYQRFDASGVRSGAAITLDTGPDFDSNPSVAVAAEANFPRQSTLIGVAFQRSAAAGQPTAAWLALRNPDGSPSLTPVLIDGEGATNANIDLAASLTSILRSTATAFTATYEDSQWVAGSVGVSQSLLSPMFNYYSVVSRIDHSAGVHARPFGGPGILTVAYNATTSTLQALLPASDLAINATPGNFVEGRPLLTGLGQYLIVETNSGGAVPGADGSASSVDILAVTAHSLTQGDASNETIFLPNYCVNVAYGDGGDDLVYGGGAAVNEIHGGGGADALYAGSVQDTLFGDAGDDALHGSSLGGSILVGGAGNDTYDLGILTSNIPIENPGEGYDTVITSAEEYFLGPSLERLIGDGFGYQLLVGNELDNVVAFSGTTTTVKTMYGLGGDDVLMLTTTGGVLVGGDGADRLVGAAGDDYMVGDAGDDVIVSGYGVDSLFGGTGDDYLIAGYAYGGNLQDYRNVLPGAVLDGGDGADILWGSSLNDYIVGGAGADLLIGGDANDYLFGGEGADTIYGGIGIDYVYGGAGNDFIWLDDAPQLGRVRPTDYVYVGGGTGVDTVADFQVATSADYYTLRDVIVVSPASGITNFAQAQAAMSQAGVYTVLNLGGGDALYLYNVQPFQLTADNFLFF